MITVKSHEILVSQSQRWYSRIYHANKSSKSYRRDNDTTLEHLPIDRVSGVDTRYCEQINFLYL